MTTLNLPIPSLMVNVGITGAPVRKARRATTGVVHAFLPKKSTNIPSSRLVFWSISIATISFLLRHLNISLIAFFFAITPLLKAVLNLYISLFINLLSRGLTTKLSLKSLADARAPTSQLPIWAVTTSTPFPFSRAFSTFSLPSNITALSTHSLPPLNTLAISAIVQPIFLDDSFAILLISL